MKKYGLKIIENNLYKINIDDISLQNVNISRIYF